MGLEENRDGHRDEANLRPVNPIVRPRDPHGGVGRELNTDCVVVSDRAGRAVLRLQDGVGRHLAPVVERHRHAQRCDERGGERRNQASKDPLPVGAHECSVWRRSSGGQVNPRRRRKAVSIPPATLLLP